MRRGRYFLIDEFNGYANNVELHTVDVLAILDDLTNEEARRIQDVIDLRLGKHDIGEYVLVKDDGSPQSLLYFIEARKNESLMRIRPPCNVDSDSTDDDIVDLAILCADAVRAERKESEPLGRDVLNPPVAGNADEPILNEAERNILSVIREAGCRLTTNKVLAALESNYGAAAESTTKTALAGLHRRKLLTNRQDTIPKGYGLPEWD